MRHAGMLRIDHVMALSRLYWIPSGRPATEGAYVDYPFGDLLRIVALESRRHRCAVIGEDLGTVPEGFRETMQAANVLSYRVFVFERTARRQLRAAATTIRPRRRHGGDARYRDPEGLLARPRHRVARAARPLSRRGAQRRGERKRRRDRRLPARCAQRKGCSSPNNRPNSCRRPASRCTARRSARRCIAISARSRARLMLVQLEDVAAEAEQANLPGTNDQHPNWRRSLSRPSRIFSPAATWRGSPR